MTPTLDRRHPTIRRLRALRGDPARRESESVFVAEGIHLVQEALASGSRLELIVVSPRLAGGEEGRALLAAIRRAAATCHETSDSILESIQDTRSPQPVLALVCRPEWPTDAGLDSSGAPPLIGVACGVQDPGNLGSLIRTLHAAGGTACFVTDGTASPFHPRAVRASMGSIFRLPVHTERTSASLLDRLRHSGVTSIGTASGGDTDYTACDMRRPVALFFGAEGAGLPHDLLSALDQTLRVPMHAEVESLSVGAAAAVMLFEVARQRNRAATTRNRNDG